MIYPILLLDFLLYSLTPYNLHLVVLGIPFVRSFLPVFVYFLLLSFYEPRYLINMLVLYILYSLNGFLKARFHESPLVNILKLVVFYAVYFLLLSFVTGFWPI